MTNAKHSPPLNKALIDDLVKEEKGIRPGKPKWTNWELQFVLAEVVAILLAYFTCEYGAGVRQDAPVAPDEDGSGYDAYRDYI